VPEEKWGAALSLVNLMLGLGQSDAWAVMPFFWVPIREEHRRSIVATPVVGRAELEGPGAFNDCDGARAGAAGLTSYLVFNSVHASMGFPSGHLLIGTPRGLIRTNGAHKKQFLRMRIPWVC